MKKLLFILIIPFVFMSFTVENDIDDILKKFYKAYSKNISLSYRVDYVNHQGGRELYDRGNSHFTSETYFINKDGVTYYGDKDYSIEISSKEKYIYVNDPIERSRNDEKGFNLDSIVKNLKEQYEAILSQEKENYIISIDLGVYEMNYYFSKKKYYLTKLVYHFKKNKNYKSMEINYTDIKFGIKPTYRSYKNFFRVKKNKCKGVGKYKNYEIICTHK